MAEPLHATEPLAPDLSHLVTEDDKPVDNRFHERQETLLTTALFDSWDQGKPFEALTEVGLFSQPDNETVVVPDFLLSLGISPRPVTGAKEDRSYYTWLYGKSPDLVIEIVSNSKGGELEGRFQSYQRIRVSYYAVYDPFRELGNRPLRLFQLVGGRYVDMADPFGLPDLGLGLSLWEGEFMDVTACWLRFVDSQGRLLLTGRERERKAQDLAEQERQRAERERQRAEQEREQRRLLTQALRESIFDTLASRFEIPEGLGAQLDRVEVPTELAALLKAARTEAIEDWMARLRET